MQSSQNKKTLQIVLLVLIAVLTIGIGYASITAINLIINGNATASVNQNNFVVHFVSADEITGTEGVGGTATYSEINAEFDLAGLTKVGDYAIAKYTIRNDSAAIGAEITLELENSNPEYFKVTEIIDSNKLPAGEETYATIRVEMIKTPINDEETTVVTAKLKANPIDNENAVGGIPKSNSVPKEYSYAIVKYPRSLYINQTIPSDVNVYKNFNNEEMNSFGHNSFLAFVLEDEIIKEAYVVFKRNGEIFYLHGGAEDESGLDSKPIYEENVMTLKKAYGGDNWSSYCSETENDCGEGCNSFNCFDGVFRSKVETSGYVFIGTRNNYYHYWNCHVGAGGFFRCYG